MEETGDHQGRFPELPLSDFIERRIEPVDRETVSLDELNVIAKITFGGELHIRTPEEKLGYKGPLFYARPGDLVISKIRVAQGSLCIVPDELEHLAVSPEYPVYRVDRNKVLPEFIRLAIRTEMFRERISGLRSGNTTKARIRPLQFEVLRIPVPTLAEQQALVDAYTASLREAQALETEAERIDREAVRAFEEALGITPSPALSERPIFIARFKDLDHWGCGMNAMSDPEVLLTTALYPCKKMEDVASINPPTSVSVRDEDEVSFVLMEAVSELNGSIILNKTRKFTEVKRGYSKFREGDIIWAKITPCMQNGKCAVATNLVNGFGAGSTEFHVIRAGREVLPWNLWALLRLPSVRKAATFHFTGSAGQQRVPADFLKKLVIPIPPIEEQTRLVNRLLEERKVAQSKRAAAQTLREQAWTAFESALFK